MAGPAGDFTFAGVPPGQYTIKVLRVPRPRGTATPGQSTQIQVGDTMVVTSTTYFGPIDGSDPGRSDAVCRPADRRRGDGPDRCPRLSAERRTRDWPLRIRRQPRAARRGGDRALPHPHGTGRRAAAEPGDESAPRRARRRHRRVQDLWHARRPLSAPPGRHAAGMDAAIRGQRGARHLRHARSISARRISPTSSSRSPIVRSRLTGVARGSDGSPDRDALIVVFPADPAGWSDFGLNPRRLRSARPAKNGMFTFVGLPAGEYCVAAIREEVIAQWQDPAVLEELARSAATVRARRRRDAHAGCQDGGGPR